MSTSIISSEGKYPQEITFFFKKLNIGFNPVIVNSSTMNEIIRVSKELLNNKVKIEQHQGLKIILNEVLPYANNTDQKSQLKNLIERITDQFSKKEGLTPNPSLKETIFEEKDLDSRSPQGSISRKGFLLMRASAEGDINLLKRFLSEGVDFINAVNSNGETALYYACANGHKEVAELLLNKGAKIEAVDQMQCTPLHQACAKGHKEVVELLLDKKANVEAVDRYQCTPLHLACKYGRIEVAKFLLERGAKIEAVDKDQCTPLHQACAKGHKEVVELLLDKKANVEAVDKDQCTPLHLACWNGYKEVVELLLDKKANVEAVNKDQCTPLHLACKYGRIEVAKFLLERGAKIEAVDKDQCTPLHLACWNGYKEVVELLLDKKANVEAVNKDQCTPLHLACAKGHKEVVELLLDKKANVEAVNKDQWTPLHFACDNGSKDLAELLLERGAKIEAVDRLGWTAFHEACGKGYRDLAKLLLERGAKIEAVTKDQLTPLHLACGNGHKEVVELLLDKKTNVEAVDRYQCTPLHLACKYGRIEVAKFLLERGAKIEAVDKDKWTPLHFACEGGHKEVVELLLDKKANVEPVCKYQQVPLHLACKNGFMGIALKLRQAGASVSCRDHLKRNPLLVAIQNSYELLAKKLVQKEEEKILCLPIWSPEEIKRIMTKKTFSQCESKEMGLISEPIQIENEPFGNVFQLFTKIEQQYLQGVFFLDSGFAITTISSYLKNISPAVLARLTMMKPFILAKCFRAIPVISLPAVVPFLPNDQLIFVLKQLNPADRMATLKIATSEQQKIILEKELQNLTEDKLEGLFFGNETLQFYHGAICKGVKSKFSKETLLMQFKRERAIQLDEKKGRIPVLIKILGNSAHLPELLKSLLIRWKEKCKFIEENISKIIGESQKEEVVVPNEFKCSITDAIMVVPAYIGNLKQAQRIEHSALIKIVERYRRDPYTNKEAEVSDIKIDQELKQKIAKFLEDHPELK